MRIRLTLSYDGTAYHGWQVQPGLATIQGTLQQVLEEIEGRKVAVDGSGRTDAKVHALGQVAAFNLVHRIPMVNLRKAINRLLPRDIRILDAQIAAPEFHPRFNARAKTYEYRIWRPEICPPFERLYVHHYPYPLDEDAMIRLAPVFEGEHDFTSFSAADEKDDLGRSKKRRIWMSRMERQGEKLVYRVRGSGFLKHMVRNITGVLVEVGKGNLTLQDLERRLQPECGIPAGPSLPGCGLFLMNVEYD